MTDPTPEILEHLLWLKGRFPDHTIYEMIHRAVETVNPSLMDMTYVDDSRWHESTKTVTERQKNLISDHMLLESLQKFRKISQSF
jgi:hypothetical protein